MPRILLTGFFGIPGPTRAGVQMHLVMRALSRHHEVDVLAVREPEQAHLERTGTARILRVPMAAEGPRAQIEGFRRALRRQLESTDYDVVHFRDGWSGTVALELRAQYGYQTVFDATRAPVAEPPLMDMSLSAELGRSEELCMAQADHVLVPSALARDHALRRRSRGVHIVPPGVDVDLFDWDDLPPGPPMLLYAGAVEAGRGLRGLLRAMTTVAQRSDARLVLAGRAAAGAARSLIDTAAELGLRDRVELRGEVAHEAMPELIARATVCVAPSAVELGAQPMAVAPTKLLEYMACRRAVVAPRRGTVTTLLEHGVSGMLFQPGDPADMAAKLIALLQDAEARERLAGAGYRLVREYHTASAMRRALRRAYTAMQLGDTRPHSAMADTPTEIPAPTPAARAAKVAAAPDHVHADAAGVEHGEAERTDQIAVPYAGLPPFGPGNTAGTAAQGEAGELTDVEVTQLPPAATEVVWTGGGDTLPDPGPDAGPATPVVIPAGLAAGPGRAASPLPALEDASRRQSSHWETFQMPALQLPRPAPRGRAGAPGRDDRDYRAVSGEVEIRTPASGARGAELDEAEAPRPPASVLLGDSKDDGE
jgi:phosphatidylinositol alpha-mannosyltransferase